MTLCRLEDWSRCLPWLAGWPAHAPGPLLAFYVASSARSLADQVPLVSSSIFFAFSRSPLSRSLFRTSSTSLTGWLQLSYPHRMHAHPLRRSPRPTFDRITHDLRRGDDVRPRQASLPRGLRPLRRRSTPVKIRRRRGKPQGATTAGGSGERAGRVQDVCSVPVGIGTESRPLHRAHKLPCAR